MTNYQKQRQDMIDNHLKSRDITDPRIINAIRNVPRENFVPQEYKELAYKDNPLPIGNGQTISQPYIVAKMCQILNLQGHEKILDIGTGLGYQAAVLSHLVTEVITIEIKKKLGEKAKENLKSYDNITVIIKNGREGYKQKAPYDAIKSAAASKKIPDSWKKQLKMGGKIIYPQERNFGQQLVKLTKTENGFNEKLFSRVRFVKLVD